MEEREDEPSYEVYEVQEEASYEEEEEAAPIEPFFGRPRPLGAALGLSLTPFLGEAQIGLATAASLTYRADVPFAFHLSLDPFAIARGEVLGGARALTYALRADAALDLRLFELGAGAGFQRFRGELPARGGEVFTERLSPGFSVHGRLGAVDGLRADIRLGWVHVAEALRFDDLALFAQLPVGDDAWLIARLRLGLGMGFALCEAGARVALRSADDPRGGLFLTATLGFLAMGYGVPGGATDALGGGMASVGLELRMPPPSAEH